MGKKKRRCTSSQARLNRRLKELMKSWTSTLTMEFEEGRLKRLWLEEKILKLVPLVVASRGCKGNQANAPQPGGQQVECMTGGDRVFTENVPLVEASRGSNGNQAYVPQPGGQQVECTIGGDDVLTENTPCVKASRGCKGNQAYVPQPGGQLVMEDKLIAPTESNRIYKPILSSKKNKGAKTSLVIGKSYDSKKKLVQRSSELPSTPCASTASLST